MNKKYIARQLPHYLALVGILLAGFVAFCLFSYDRVFQIAVAISLAVSYVVWGIVHHLIRRDFCLAVLIEYILVATLGLVIVFSLIFRA